MGAVRKFKKSFGLTVENYKFFFILGILTVFLSFFSLFLGDIAILPWQILNGKNAQIIWELRLPRTLLALEVGAALALSGAALQAFMQNPLADPALTGASSGAALGAAIVFYYALFPTLACFALPLAALIGALLSLLLLFLFAGFFTQSLSPETLILAGIAISSLGGATLSALLNFAPNPFAMQELVFWLLGSVANRGFLPLYFLTPALVLGGFFIFKTRYFLNALTLGTVAAQSMGFSVFKMSAYLMTGAAILVGSSVAAAGSIGFVGLIVPHIVRKIYKAKPSDIFIPSAFLGALLVLFSDIIVRLLPGTELKLGIVTAFIGAPFFVFLLCQRRF